MTSYVPPIKNGAGGWIGYVSLAPRTANGQWQSNPTLASGDVKISIDGGALANLTTLPAVTPASSKLVKITLSQAETNGDNLTIIFSDAAGAEWCDLTINLQTVARQINDLAFPNTSGRGITVDASGNANANLVNIAGAAVSTTTAQLGVNVVQAGATAWGSGAITAASIAASALNGKGDWNVGKTGYSLTATTGLGNQTADITGNLSGSVGSVVGLTPSNLDATISSRLASASYTAPDNASIAAILEDTAEIGVAGAGLTALASAASLSTVDTVVDAIKAKTDNLPASPAATGDAMALTAAAVDAIHDEVVEGTLTFRQSMRLQNSTLFGLVSGGNTTTVTFRDIADTLDRIVATVDSDGNRTALVTNVS